MQSTHYSLPTYLPLDDKRLRVVIPEQLPVALPTPIPLPDALPISSHEKYLITELAPLLILKLEDYLMTKWSYLSDQVFFV